MWVKEVHISNFKSFNDSSLKIPIDKGLFLIRGENVDAGGSIGSGKTSLMEAIAVGLFGRSPSGLTATECVKLGEDDYNIDLVVQSGEDELYIQRSLKDLIINIAGSDLTKTQKQELINNFIGCDVKTFFACVFVGSDWNSIFDMTPSSRLSFLTGLFNLSLFDKCYKKVSNKIKKIQSDIKDNEMKLAQLLGRAKELQNSYMDKVIEWEQERKALVMNIEREKRKLFDRIDNLKNDIKDLQDKMASLDEMLAEMNVADLENQISLYEKEIDSLTSRLEVLKGRYEVVKTELENVNKHLAFITKHSSCPLCGADLNDKDLLISMKRHKSELLSEIDSIADEIEKITEERDAKKSSLAQLRVTMKKVTSVEQEKLRLKLKQERLRDEVKLLREKIKELSERIVSITSEENPYKKLEEERKQKLDVVMSRISKLNIVIEELKKSLSMYEFWKEGFPEVKKILVKNIMVLIADRMNHYLQYLGVDYSVEVIIDDTKIEFFFKRGKNKFSFKNLSSGEKQVARISLALTLHDIAVNIIGKNIGVFFFDEPLRNLDVERKNKVFQLLNDLAQKNQVFVIDHSPEFTNRFDYVITVRKENGVSYVSSTSF